MVASSSALRTTHRSTTSRSSRVMETTSFGLASHMDTDGMDGEWCRDAGDSHLSDDNNEDDMVEMKECLSWLDNPLTHGF